MIQPPASITARSTGGAGGVRPGGDALPREVPGSIRAGSAQELLPQLGALGLSTRHRHDPDGEIAPRDGRSASRSVVPHRGWGWLRWRAPRRWPSSACVGRGQLRSARPRSDPHRGSACSRGERPGIPPRLRLALGSTLLETAPHDTGQWRPAGDRPRSAIAAWQRRVREGGAAAARGDRPGDGARCRPPRIRRSGDSVVP